MATSHAIAIGPEFFEKAKREYSDWIWAIAREYCQNSIDSGADRIEISIAKTGENTALTVRNDGEIMSKDVLMNKLLTLGGSNKNFNGGVGGMGVAKHILYFCHEKYIIATGNLMVTGSGGSYNLAEDASHINGTESHIIIKGDLVEELATSFTDFVGLCQWTGTFILNGKAIINRLKKGFKRKETEWGTIYTNNNEANCLVVRINGQPMFTKHCGYRGTVLIELKGTSDKVLTSNRDGLLSKPQSALDQFLTDICTNGRKAFREKKTVDRKFYKGYKLGGKGEEKVDNTSWGSIADANQAALTVIVTNICNATKNAKATEDAPELEPSDVLCHLTPEFHIRSEIGGKIPDWFLPATFSTNSRRLISSWISILVELANITKLDKKFGVGFVFDCEDEPTDTGDVEQPIGLYETVDDENIVFVSPVKILMKIGKPRQLQTRWKFDAEGNWWLLSVAIHEFCHLEGYTSHDEDYARRLTELFSIVLANRTRFSRHFSAPVCWPA